MFVIYTLSTFSDVLHCSQILYDIPNLKVNYTIFTVKKTPANMAGNIYEGGCFYPKDTKSRICFSYVFFLFFLCETDIELCRSICIFQNLYENEWIFLNGF